MTKRFPARLHVLLASAAPAGVVFRRGPVTAVCSVLWKRDTDEFQMGQWLRARIYERRADLSPDGRHVIYFARGARSRPETRGSWTAISRAPWLKAIVLLGKGDCWQGGGLFTSNSSYWVNGPRIQAAHRALLKHRSPQGPWRRRASLFIPGRDSAGYRSFRSRLGNAFRATTGGSGSHVNQRLT